MNTEYKPTIGLEIHAELKTKTKMFCDSPNKTFGERPNTNICPVCMGHPGTLPVINKEAVRHVLKIGTALEGELASFTEFDRKNYFYPDIPKGYQISQYAYPLVRGGRLSGVDITRIHLEEDTARSMHHEGHSLIDYNRAGVPLMELVTEPVIRNAKEAVDFARELQLTLRYCGASDANMELGEMRVEANISVLPSAKSQIPNSKSQTNSNTQTLGTKVEVKNLNSFRAVFKAIDYEVARQKEMLMRGEELVQETRGWDEDKEETFRQRVKETSEDYRYFPDPDLPKLQINEIEEFNRDVLYKELPELPWVRRERLLQDFGLKEETASLLVTNQILGALFDEVISPLGDDKEGVHLASNYITSDLASLWGEDEKEEIAFNGKEFAELITMIQNGELSSRGAKDTLRVMYEEGGSPQEIAQKEGLMQKSDEGELRTVVEEVIAENSDAVSEYKEGKENALQFLIGQAMKKTHGSANPQVVRELFTSLLNT